MRRVNSDIVGGPYLWAVLSDDQYRIPLARAAKRALNQALQDNPEGKLFNLLKEEFARDGTDEARALEMTWLSIMAMSMDGQNIWTLGPFLDSSSVVSVFSLAVISSVAPYLDSLSKSDSLYSFPPKVKVGCDTGKGYHFWMSAFLAKDLGGGAGEYASFISEIGYQMYARGYGRNPVDQFTSAWDSPGNQKVRLDLLYSAAGSAYGAKFSSTPPSLKLPELLGQLTRDSAKPDPLSRPDADALMQNMTSSFQRWNKIFSPKSIIGL